MNAPRWLYQHIVIIVIINIITVSVVIGDQHFAQHNIAWNGVA